MINILPNIIFSVLLLTSVGFFIYNIKKLITVIKLGKPVDRTDNPRKRLSNMIRIALGQSKMVTKPISGFLHVIVYIGFIIINIELLEILIDGVTGSHRFFSKYFNTNFYNFLIASFEILALLVLISVILFWTRRNIVKIKRFLSNEMKGWPKFDADNILYFEIVLMLLFLSMNATDLILQERNFEGYYKAGSFPVSSFMVPLFDSFETSTVYLFERIFWWLHIIGIFFFLNYLYYSKHLHILLAFPNTYYANLESKGKFGILESVKNEVLLMFYPDKASQSNGNVDKFGASDVLDLNWVQLMNAYSCTECGRCTSECPANLTGKKLSPRKTLDKQWEGQKVNLMTLHASKGLEFDVVFLPGWEEGLFPHQKSLEEKGEKGLEEERRLAYVGITRARKNLNISFAMSRFYQGDWIDGIVSRFVDELPEKNLNKNDIFENRDDDDLDFNQDIEYDSEIKSPGWLRYQKKLK